MTFVLLHCLFLGAHKANAKICANIKHFWQNLTAIHTRGSTKNRRFFERQGQSIKKMRLDKFSIFYTNFTRELRKDKKNLLDFTGNQLMTSSFSYSIGSEFALIPPPTSCSIMLMSDSFKNLFPGKLSSSILQFTRQFLLNTITICGQ